MGDRTDCSLKIWGFVTSADDTAIRAAIAETGGWAEPSLPGDHPGQSGLFFFEGVNAGELDGDVQAALHRAGLGFVWTWANGQEYSAGLRLHDPAHDIDIEYPVIDDLIHLSVREALDPVRITKAVRDEAILQKVRRLPYLVAPTAHDRIALGQKYPDLVAFLRREAA